MNTIVVADCSPQAVQCRADNERPVVGIQAVLVDCHERADADRIRIGRVRCRLIETLPRNANQGLIAIGRVIGLQRVRTDAGGLVRLLASPQQRTRHS